MRFPPSTLSRRELLVGTGALGATTTVGVAETTAAASGTSNPDWSLDAPDAKNFEPELVADGSVYAFARTDAKGTGPAERSLLAVDAATSERRWSTEVSFTPVSPTFTDGTVYVSGTAHATDAEDVWAVTALDAETGDESWAKTIT